MHMLIEFSEVELKVLSKSSHSSMNSHDQELGVRVKKFTMQI